MFDVIIIPKVVYSFRLIIIFFLCKKNLDMPNYVILNYFFIFLSTCFFFRFKNCPGVSNYSIFIYSAIMLFFSFFLLFCLKSILCPDISGRVAWWLATCARKPKVPGSSPAASYVQR